MSMKNQGMWLWLTAVIGLSACPSDDGPSGEGSTTNTNPTTSMDTTEGSGTCGNGTIEDGEECDGTDLGGATCPDVDPAYTGGTLACGASCTLDASACELLPNTPLVAINEVTSQAVLSGAYAGPNDAIELHNAGTLAADLSGWRISDDPTLPPERTYVLPGGTTLEPGEFLVLLTIDDANTAGVLPFGVSSSNVETLTLADGQGTVRDSVTVDGYLARESYCRVPDGTGAWFQCVQTFGSENQVADAPCGNGVADAGEMCDGTDLGGQTCEGLGIGLGAGTLACTPTCQLDLFGCVTDSLIVLNELSSTTDDIELYNASNADFDLSGLVLTDDRVGLDYDPALDTAELVFQAGTVLGPGEYLVVPRGLGPNQHPFGLGAMGDRVTLLAPSPLTIIDHVSYTSGQAIASWCRLPSGPDGTWSGCTPTMGSANAP
jgi:hypothetical protein